MYGVIFDVDGVLVDSYQAHFLSWQAIATARGLTMTEQQFAATFGRTSREIVRELWAAEGLSDNDVTLLDDRKEAAYRELIAERFPAMPGAVELIDALHADGFLLAAGSSGPPENVALALERLGRRERFTAVVTGTDVTRGKPDPQVFQLAAQRLELDPRRCAVVEDAAAGIAAANAAGMVSIALVSTGHHRHEYGEADQVIESPAGLDIASLRRWIDAT